MARHDLCPSPSNRGAGSCSRLNWPPNDTRQTGLVALLRRPQFARERLCNLGQFQRVRHIAVDATEFPSSRFDQDKPHWLAALRADRRRGILGHGILTLDQAGALPNSRSPNAAEDGAVILKSYNESLRGCLSGNLSRCSVLTSVSVVLTVVWLTYWKVANVPTLDSFARSGCQM